MKHYARKRFGQNFLHDAGVIARIVQAVAPRAGEHMVEIGPGLGALTRELLAQVGDMDVVELDRDLVPKLRDLLQGLGSLRIHQADALDFDFAALAHGERSLRIVGNLPYNISTPMLFHLFRQMHCIRDMHFMLQKEVVERMAAAPGTDAYGRLSVMVQFHCTAYKLFIVAPGAFTPAPQVDSAIVRLIPHAVPPVQVHNPAHFAQLVSAAFSQRRKTLRNGLKGLLNDEQIKTAGIDPQIRAERLSLQEFARLANQRESGK